GVSPADATRDRAQLASVVDFRGSHRQPCKTRIMRAVSLMALCACSGPVLSSNVAYIRTPLTTSKQTVRLCHDGSAAVVTPVFFAGSYEMDGMVATITATVEVGAGEEVFHFDLATLTLRELPDPSPWVADDDSASACDQPQLP